MEEVVGNVDFWIAIAAQAPLLAGFMFFMLRWQANADESTQRNHDEWRDWLTEERNKYREERQKAREERDAWRQFMRHRDEEHVAAMTAVEKQMALQTNILMAIVATSGNDVEKTVEALEKLTEQKE